MKECLALLQSTQPIRLPLFTPASFVVYAFAGTTAAYLIRYAASGNSLSFENTIAHQALKYAKAGLITDSKHLADLYDIGVLIDFAERFIELHQAFNACLRGDVVCKKLGLVHYFHSWHLSAIRRFRYLLMSELINHAVSTMCQTSWHLYGSTCLRACAYNDLRLPIIIS